MARKSFRFRLQRLLEIRIMREKQAQQELLVRRANLAREQQALVVLQQQEQALIDRMTPQPGQRLDFDDIRMCEYAAKLKREEQDAQRQKITAAEHAIREQQEVVKQAGIDVKALEKLREKQKEEFHEDQLREDAIFLDDLASQQFIRQQTIGSQLADEEAAAATSGEARR